MGSMPFRYGIILMPDGMHWPLTPAVRSINWNRLARLPLFNGSRTELAVNGSPHHCANGMIDYYELQSKGGWPFFMLCHQSHRSWKLYNRNTQSQVITRITLIIEPVTLTLTLSHDILLWGWTVWIILIDTPLSCKRISPQYKYLDAKNHVASCQSNLVTGPSNRYRTEKDWFLQRSCP